MILRYDGNSVINARISDPNRSYLNADTFPVRNKKNIFDYKNLTLKDIEGVPELNFLKTNLISKKFGLSESIMMFDEYVKESITLLVRSASMDFKNVISVLNELGFKIDEKSSKWDIRSSFRVCTDDFGNENWLDITDLHITVKRRNSILVREEFYQLLDKNSPGREEIKTLIASCILEAIAKHPSMIKFTDLPEKAQEKLKTKYIGNKFGI